MRLISCDFSGYVGNFCSSANVFFFVSITQENFPHSLPHFLLGYLKSSNESYNYVIIFHPWRHVQDIDFHLRTLWYARQEDTAQFPDRCPAMFNSTLDLQSWYNAPQMMMISQKSSVKSLSRSVVLV